MVEFKLLRPEDVVAQWETLRGLLCPAVEKGSGELTVEDIKPLVLGGRMFVFALYREGRPILALTAEFTVYPRKMVMLIGFGGGAGAAENVDVFWPVLQDFATKAGATAIQTYCQEPATVRYIERVFGAKRKYAVMEYPL